MNHTDRSRRTCKREPRQCVSRQRHGGLTLVETAAALAVLVVAGASLTPALNRQRQTAQSIGSLANLSQIGQISAQYGNANDDQFATYSWMRGVEYDVAGETSPRSSADNENIWMWQATDILRRRAGRIEGDDRLRHLRQVLPIRRQNHLILQDFAGRAMPDPLVRAPADGVFTRLAADPRQDFPASSPDDSRFASARYRQRLPYFSSYLPTTFVYQAALGEQDGRLPYLSPALDSVNLLLVSGDSSRFGARRRTEVVQPSLKVHYYEEFDWLRTNPQFYAFDDSSPHVLMMDGSAARRRARDATTSVYTQHTTPTLIRADSRVLPILNIFPGTRQGELVNQKFRFTKDGLAGIDFTTTADAPDTRRSAHRLRSE